MLVFQRSPHTHLASDRCKIFKTSCQIFVKYIASKGIKIQIRMFNLMINDLIGALEVLNSIHTWLNMYEFL